MWQKARGECACADGAGPRRGGSMWLWASTASRGLEHGSARRHRDEAPGLSQRLSTSHPRLPSASALVCGAALCAEPPCVVSGAALCAEPRCAKPHRRRRELARVCCLGPGRRRTRSVRRLRGPLRLARAPRHTVWRKHTSRKPHGRRGDGLRCCRARSVYRPAAAEAGDCRDRACSEESGQGHSTKVWCTRRSGR